MTVIFVELMGRDGPIVKVDASAHFLHVGKDLAMALRVNHNIPKSFWNACFVGCEENKLLMR